jgi:hypothetical protein
MTEYSVQQTHYDPNVGQRMCAEGAHPKAESWERHRDWPILIGVALGWVIPYLFFR